MKKFALLPLLLAVAAAPGFAATAPLDPPVLSLDATTQPLPESFHLVNGFKQQGPPLPVHSIEGYGGLAITPMAYLVNAGPENTLFGLPSAAFSYVNLQSKNVEAMTLTETLMGRVELGFSAERLDLGSLPAAIKKATSVDIAKDDLWLYTFSARGLVIKENQFCNFMPALTVGAHLKYNQDIADINSSLGNALRTIGYHRNTGEDFTLTASKTFANVLGHPLIVSAGMRESQAADLGFLGFGHDWSGTFEGNIAYLPTSWLLLGYEYRQNDNPFNNHLSPLIGNENDWHAFDAAFILNKNTTLVLGYGLFGNIANSNADHSFWLQLKYEF